MPIERYTVGRVGTARPRAKANWDDPEAVLTIMEQIAAGGPYTAERRIAVLERDAIAYLQQKRMPLDPNAPCYGDPAWQRENERTSLVWYAINILNTVRMLRLQVEHGDAWLAADFVLDLGVLATEAKFVALRVRKQGEGGRAPRQEIEQRRAAWRRMAEEIWERHPTWSTSEVSRLIAKDAGCSFETVRPVIADLSPKKKLVGK